MDAVLELQNSSEEKQVSLTWLKCDVFFKHSGPNADKFPLASQKLPKLSIYSRHVKLAQDSHIFFIRVTRCVVVYADAS